MAAMKDAVKGKVLRERYKGLERAADLLKPQDVVAELDMVEALDPVKVRPLQGRLNALSHIMRAKEGLLITPIPSPVKLQ